MKRTAGRVDRWIRIILGLALLSLILLISGFMRWIGLFGLLPLLTGILGYHPLDRLLQDKGSDFE